MSSSSAVAAAPAAAAAAASSSSGPPPLALAALDGSFTASGRMVRLAVVRAWPLVPGDTPSERTLRLEAREASVARGGPAAAAGVGTIEVFLVGAWAALAPAAHDVLSLRHVAALPAAPGDALEHDWKLVLDESAQGEQAECRHSGWRERVLCTGEGFLHTLASLRAQAEAASPAAAAAAALGESASASSGPPGKKQKLAAFQTASALAAKKGTLAAPIDVDNDASADGKKRKLKRGSDVHGAYIYLPLIEARTRPPKEKVNVYGVVLSWKPPRSTVGSDMVMSITVTDLSLVPGETMTFNIFRRTAGDLPPDSAVKRGDIVRFHRAEISDYNGQRVGVLRHQASSFVLLRAQGAIEPYFSPSETFSELDLDIIRALRQLSVSITSSGAADGPSVVPGPIMPTKGERPVPTLSQLVATRVPFLDLIAVLIHVDPSGESIDLAAGAQPSPHHTPLAYIWDGTDNTLGPSQLQRPIVKTLFEFPDLSDRGALVPAKRTPVTTPRFGSVMSMAYHPLAQSTFNLSTTGPVPLFVHIKNINWECDLSAHFYLKFSSLSKLIVLDPTDARVQRMMAAYEERQVTEIARLRLQPWSSIQTPPLTVPPSSLPLTPLKLLSAAAADTMPSVGKYRVRARVIDTIPRAESHVASSAASASAAVTPLAMERICKVECRACARWQDCTDVSSAVDTCQSCGSKDDLAYGYFLKLVLQDASAMTSVLLCGKEADELFHGLPAANLYSNPTTLKFVRARLARVVEAGAFLDCAVNSYEVALDPEVDGGQVSQSQLEASQMCSQDLQAFFAPQLGAMDTDMDDEAPARPTQTKRVLRVADGCLFRAL